VLALLREREVVFSKLHGKHGTIAHETVAFTVHHFKKKKN
jgi:hypothetical protein